MFDVKPGIHESNIPVMDIAIQQLQILAAFGEDKVICDALVVFEKILLDNVGLITQAQDKVFVTIVRVILHHMPEDRAISDRNHRFWQSLGVFAHAHDRSRRKKEQLS